MFIFLDHDLVTEHLKITRLRKVFLYVLRYRELYRQLEVKVRLRPPPHQVLEVAGAFLHRRIEAVGHEIPEEGYGVEQRALAAGVGADQDVEAVEPDVHVAEAAVVESLDATDHGLCL